MGGLQPKHHFLPSKFVPCFPWRLCTFQSLPTTFGCPGGCNRAIFKSQLWYLNAIKSSFQKVDHLTSFKSSAVSPTLQTKVVGWSQGIPRNKDGLVSKIPGGSSETVARGPNKFDEHVPWCPTWNSCQISFWEKKQSAKWAKQQLENITTARISPKLWAKSFQQWFLSSYSWFFYFFSNTYPISQKMLSNVSIPL